MQNKLCIHCAQKDPCPYQDGIYCKTTPCVRDNPGAGSGRSDDFIKTFRDMFGGGSGPFGGCYGK